MTRRVLIALAGAVLAWSGAAKADECVQRFDGQVSSDNWEAELARYVRKRQSGQDGGPQLAAAVRKLDGEIQNFDALKPGPLYTVAQTLTKLESAVDEIRLCIPATGSGRGALPASQVTAWKDTLTTSASEFVTVYGERWEAFLLRHEIQARTGRATLYTSPMMRRILQAQRPALWAEIDTPENAEAARELSARRQAARETLAESGRAALAQTEAQDEARDKAERSVAVRRAAIQALPQKAGAWTRSSQYAYTRTTRGIVTTLYCGSAGGLVLRLKYPNGRFVSGDTDSVAIQVDQGGRERRVFANLRQISSSTSTTQNNRGEVETTTTLFDPSEATLSIQSPKMLAALNRGMLRSVGAMADGAVGGGQTTYADVLDALGQMAGSMAPAFAPLVLDIDEIKSQPSLKITVVPLGGPPLLDLEPTRAPFKNLMDACWG